MKANIHLVDEVNAIKRKGIIMNWIKIIHLKNEEEVAINIMNMSFEEGN